MKKFLFKKWNYSILVCMLLAIFVVTGCQKEENLMNDKEKTKTLNNNVLVLNEDQKIQRDKLEQIAQIVVNIADNKTIFDEIKNGVSISLELKLDEQYRFDDILHPIKSKIAKLKHNKIGIFSERLKKAINVEKEKSLNYNDLESFILKNDIQIYWPYSEEWDGITEPIISFNPIIDTDENIGFKRVKQQDGSIKIDTVLINDDFAYKNPVWIINFCENNIKEIEIAEKRYAKLNNKSTINQLSIGQIKSTKHYDNIFTGGDEYKFCIIGGKITSWQTAESFENIQSVNVSRSDIRKKRWKSVYYELDDNWKSDIDNNELGRKFGLIEYDKNKTTQELKFEPKVIIDKITVQLGSYSLKTESSEGWIKVDMYEDREIFLQFQNTDTGNGLIDDYKVFGAGGIYWTLPLRQF